MKIQSALKLVMAGNSLAQAEMIEVMKEVMTGEATPAQIAGFLVALAIKGETVDEIAGAAKVMRELSTKVDLNPEELVDTCGTGGDGQKIFNVSTASAFVVAAAGGKVAKHGNRSITSSSGSADVLEAAGVNLDISPEQVARCVNEIGVGFMFAVKHHGAMKHAIGPRKELAVRTIFNVLGPLTNPAGALRQVIGVYSSALVRPLAEVLLKLGSEHVLVVHSEDGLDEISIAAPTFVAEVKDGEITEYTIQPEDFGITRMPLDSLQVETAEESLALIKRVFGKESSAAADMVVLNAGAAIYAADIASSLKEGVTMARDAIGCGMARAKLNDLVDMTQAMS